MEHDLLADLGRSEDPRKLWVYQRVLSPKNNDQWDHVLADQPLKQIADIKRQGSWNCGGALDRFARNFGSGHYRFGGARYYKPFIPKPHQANRVIDIEFDAEKVRHGAHRLRTLGAQRTAVTVYAVLGQEGFGVVNGTITHPHTHYVTIIGCNKDGSIFLHVDPWPGGSMMTYTSAIFGNVPSIFMGTLVYRKDAHFIHRFLGDGYDEKIQRDTIGTGSYESSHRYLLLTGP
jgi:hypothetical protein